MSPRLRVLIAEDELLARQRLGRLLAAIPDVELIGACETADEVLARVRGEPVDVLLLDIQMPGLSGLEAKALLPEDEPYVIFVTAHAEHALEAFDVGAVDYVLKPIDPVRLQRALERARARIRTREPHRDLERLAVSTREGIVLVDLAELSHATFDGTLVELATSRGRLLTDLSLQALEERLPKNRFARVHRRALVNLTHVSVLEPNESGGLWARMRGGALVPISRQSARRLRRRLGLD